MSGIAVPGMSKAGRPVRRARATKTPKKYEKAVRDELLKLVAQLNMDVTAVTIIFATASPSVINQLLNQLQERWRETFGNKSDAFAKVWASTINVRNKAAFEASLANALGVEYTSVFDDKVLYDALDASAYEASTLIKTIPEEYLSQVHRAVMTNYQQLELPEGRSLIEELQHIYGVTKSRARVIARDQSSKINTALTQARNEEVGIEEYIWRTAEDIRVVGTPGGISPVGNHIHGNHYIRNRRVFRWDTPPPDGHPGYAINCRCYAEPKVVVDKLKIV